MERPAKQKFWPWGLALLALGAVALVIGCNKADRTPACVFEARPRPVLEGVGVAESWDPTLAVDTAGTLYLFTVYQQNSKPRLGLLTSHDGGDTLAPSVLPISEADASIGSHGEQSPSVAMARGEIYALWQQIEAEPFGNDHVRPLAVVGREF